MRQHDSISSNRGNLQATMHISITPSTQWRSVGIAKYSKTLPLEADNGTLGAEVCVEQAQAPLG